MKKKSEVILKILKCLVALTGVVLLIAHFISPDYWNKPWSYAATILLPFFPDILKAFGLRASTRLQLAYVGFLVFAMIGGIDFDLYRTWYIFGNPCYDKIVHVMSGILAAYVAKEILDGNYNGIDIRVTGSNKLKVKHYDTRFTWCFIVAFVAMTAAGWECFEFLYDQITGGTMQILIADGLDDTMWDMISAISAGIIFAFPLSNK